MSATVEWVETTGKTVEEAKEAALDQLGVDEVDAEFEVLEEPRAGLFGRTRGTGRVRARILPKAPRPKQDRRRKTKGGSDEADGSASAGGRSGSNRTRSRQKSGGTGGAAGSKAVADKPDKRDSNEDELKDDSSTEPVSTGPNDNRGSSRGDAKKRRESPDRERSANKERELMDEAEQCEVVKGFLDGLGTAFGLEVTTTAEIEGDVLRAAIDGSEVGLFIGPRLGTLDALQEIARNVLQRHADGREYAKVVLDVAGVRELRRAALSTFVTDAAQTVLDEGVEVTFEVMSSPDRKVVHDTVSDIEGVESTSVGEDPRRRVVIRPA